ncbi:MAG: UMP kinase [bacterium]|nr:UMP kinase [bacterium]
MKKTIVISLGGSLIFPKAGIDTKFLKQFRSLIVGYVQKGWKFVIITGGGTIARQYQDALRHVGVASHIEHDWIAIRVTRVNAHLLRILFGNYAHDTVIMKPTEAHSGAFGNKKILLAGGEKPGQTTDCVAVKCAIGVGADMVLNLSNVDYIYDCDPRKYPEAKKLHALSWSEFQKLFPRRHTPGSNVPFDPVATALAKKHKLTVGFLGANLPNVKNFLEQRKFRGTVVTP